MTRRLRQRVRLTARALVLTASRATVPGKNGLIVLVDSRLVTMNVDGTGVKPMTAGHGAGRSAVAAGQVAILHRVVEERPEELLVQTRLTAGRDEPVDLFRHRGRVVAGGHIA